VNDPNIRKLLDEHLGLWSLIKSLDDQRQAAAARFSLVAQEISSALRARAVLACVVQLDDCYYYLHVGTEQFPLQIDKVAVIE